MKTVSADNKVNQSLAKLREGWEKDQHVIGFYEFDLLALSIIKAPGGYYRLHRYFVIGATWEISVDHQKAGAGEMLDWIVKWVQFSK